MPHDMLSGASVAHKNKNVSFNSSTPQSQDQQRSQKRKRPDNRYNREVSMQKGNSTRTPESGCRDLQTTLINVGLMNIAAIPLQWPTEEKFENLNNLSNDLHLHAVVLSEHQLSSTDTPSYVSRHGWEMHISRGPKKRGSRRSHNGGVALLVREKMVEVERP
jgi:hypothetical protein